MEPLTYGDRSWKLERLPLRADEPLRAWTTADLLLVKHATEEGLLDAAERVLIVNDPFGALGVALHERRPQWWSDSFVATRALRHNLDLNDRDEEDVTCVAGDRTPAGPIDLVLLRLPKSLAWLEDQLLRLRPVLAPGAVVVAGGMIKHTPRRAFELLEACIGPTTTGLGWKKARLGFAKLDAGLACAEGVAPKVVAVDGLPIASRPNVFSWERLDLGTRLLLSHLGASESALEIIDQGCGSGVLALALAKAYPNARVLGVDESYQAVASARENAAAAGLEGGRVLFDVNDDLRAASEGQADLIVCNPPFHQGQAVGDQVAWGMFGQARASLARGGEYLVVGNQHMHYHEKLKRLFGNYAVVASDKKFVVLKAKRT